MLNIGAGEIAIILVVALLVLGPKRLPELARGIGKFLREFRRQTDEVRTTLESEFYRMDQDLLREPPKRPAQISADAESQPAPSDANPTDPVPKNQPEVNKLPPIFGPLDGGRRVADEILPRRPAPAPVSPAAANAPPVPPTDEGARPEPEVQASPEAKDGTP